MSSSRAKHWAWSQLDISRSELLLLLAMADNVGESLMCYASVTTLRTMARMSERTAQRTLDSLWAVGKVARVDRPGRTTLFQLLIPPDFGRTSSARKGSQTPDKMTGVDGQLPLGATPDTVEGVTPDKMTGVLPPSDWHPPPSKRRGTPANLAPNSSLNSSLPNPSSHARAPDGAGALTREQDRKLGQLRHRAMVVGVSPPTESEVIDLIDGGRTAERRIEEAETRSVQARAEQIRREREQPPAPPTPAEECA